MRLDGEAPPICTPGELRTGSEMVGRRPFLLLPYSGSYQDRGERWFPVSGIDGCSLLLCDGSPSVGVGVVSGL